MLRQTTLQRRGTAAAVLSGMLLCAGLARADETSSGASPGEVQAWSDRGKELALSGKVQEGVTWLRKAADTGHAEACYLLGMCYVQCWKKEAIKEAGVGWLRKAVKKDYVPAQFELAFCLLKGIGVEKDETEAFKLLKLVADQSLYEVSSDPDPMARQRYLIAQSKVAECYLTGKGVARDLAGARSYARGAGDKALMERILKARHEELQAAVAEDGATPEQWCKLGRSFVEGRGGERDPEEGVRWLRKAGEKGHARACYLVHQAYIEGIGVEADERMAATWLRKAADNGVRQAQCELAEWLMQGRGLEKDEAEAFKIFKSIADKGYSDLGPLGSGDDANTWGQYKLAATQVVECYLEGRGVDKSLERAKEFARGVANADGGVTKELGVPSSLPDLSAQLLEKVEAVEDQMSDEFCKELVNKNAARLKSSREHWQRETRKRRKRAEQRLAKAKEKVALLEQDIDTQIERLCEAIEKIVISRTTRFEYDVTSWDREKIKLRVKEFRHGRESKRREMQIRVLGMEAQKMSARRGVNFYKVVDGRAGIFWPLSRDQAEAFEKWSGMMAKQFDLLHEWEREVDKATEALRTLERKVDEVREMNRSLDKMTEALHESEREVEKAREALR